jgi:hypothetical protein
MVTNCNSEAGDIQAQIYFEKVKDVTGTDWNVTVNLNLKYSYL